MKEIIIKIFKRSLVIILILFIYTIYATYSLSKGDKFIYLQACTISQELKSDGSFTTKQENIENCNKINSATGYYILGSDGKNKKISIIKKFIIEKKYAKFPSTFKGNLTPIDNRFIVTNEPIENFCKTIENGFYNCHIRGENIKIKKFEGLDLTIPKGFLINN